MLNCENCSQVHSGDYGSGRFCSKKCARGFSTKHNRAEINKKVSTKLLGTSRKDKDGYDEYIGKRIGSFKDTWVKKNKEKISNVMDVEFESLTQKLKRLRILKEQNLKCSECGVGEIYNNKPLKFELDHISGDRSDETRKNLRLVCPNCHSQTDTYKTLNVKKKNGVVYTDEMIIAALESNSSVYNALRSLGMNPHGGNYNRIRRIIKKYSLQLNLII